MHHDPRTRVLCVDDEPALLQSMVLHLTKHDFHVVTAESGAAGLACLAHQGPFAVVVSDMRMPGMDGAAFLAAARARAPDMVRMLLTGHADIEHAIAAVNEGQIFRLLLKPCPLDRLLQALDAAVAQHQLLTAERVLLEQTLHGSIKALTEVLALVNPMAFGRAKRLRDLVRDLATGLGHGPSWELDVAAMLSQVACVTLPAELTEKVHYGEPLVAAELALVDDMPNVAEQLLRNIPRLDGVRAILRHQARRYDGLDRPADPVRQEDLPLGARLLKLATDFDALVCHRLTRGKIIEELRSRQGCYDPAAVEVLARLHGSEERVPAIRQVALREVQPGMIFAADVHTAKGVLIIARGQEATESLLGMVQRLPAGFVREPVSVVGIAN